MILAGDIGGTKVHLALFESSGKSLTLKRDQVFSSKEHVSLESLVTKWTTETGIKPTAACFGVAGPVQDGICQTTNLPWRISAYDLADELGGIKVSLLNDLEANAYGIRELKPEEFYILQKGDSHIKGNAGLISPGTGLGEAGLYWDGKQHLPFACEGGHADYAPSSEVDTKLYLYLREKFGHVSHGHVSWERVLSGPGLVNIYDFVTTQTNRVELKEVTEEMAKGDAAAVISKAALEGSSHLCGQALDIFIRNLGSQAGNLALTFLSTGGFYIGGGIAPKILDKLKGPEFLESFLAKGRLSFLLESMPVKVILNPDTALLGAASYVSSKS